MPSRGAQPWIRRARPKNLGSSWLIASMLSAGPRRLSRHGHVSIVWGLHLSAPRRHRLFRKPDLASTKESLGFLAYGNLGLLCPLQYGHSQRFGGQLTGHMADDEWFTVGLGEVDRQLAHGSGMVPGTNTSSARRQLFIGSRDEEMIGRLQSNRDYGQRE